MLNLFLLAALLSLVATLCYLNIRTPGRPLPPSYRDRGCMERAWHERFPNAQEEDIHRFLHVFAVQAFGFREAHCLSFSPDDRVMSVFSELHPPSSRIDDFELENFGMAVENEFGIDLANAKLWREDATLGEIFAATRKTAVG